MRHVCSVIAALLALAMFSPPKAIGQTGATGLSIGNYVFVSEARSTRTQWLVTYRAELVNNGPARPATTATVSSLVPTVQVVPDQRTLQFAAVGANSRTLSINTFTILVDRSVPFDFNSLSWAFLNPIANAGANQTAAVGATVALSGAGSSNPSGVGTLAYSWAFASRPPGSSAVLSNANTVSPSFSIDVAGNYVITLTVNNGAASDSSQVTVSTVNTAPVANAGASQTVGVGATVTLNGSGSSDVDGDPLTYQWSLVSRPSGSNAILAAPNSITTTFNADKSGTYLVQLTVNDGKVNSEAKTVTITTINTTPVAAAGPGQTVAINALVQLNGAGSTDVDGDSLIFKWSLITVPSGSIAVLSSTTTVNPTFTADRAGSYVAQLIVNDGKIDSAPSTVTITTSAPQAPVAHAGLNQTVVHGTTVQLSGTGTDPQSLPLTFTWSLITRPAGSTAVLSSNSIPNPTFVADKPGMYVAQLIVGNGTQNSTPSTVTINTINTEPVANAGLDQSVLAGATVTLDGSGSFDVDTDPLTYSWTFTSQPAGSTAVLSAATSKTPTFLADIAGTYVVQLIVSDGFANSAPSTVTITAGASRITFSPSPLNLTVAPATLTVGLTVPAGLSGLTVTLSGFDPNVISLNPIVNIPADATGANVTVTPVAAGTTNILATAPGFQPAMLTVNVSTPTITLTLAPAVGVGRTINGTIQLSSPAPPSGTIISLSATPGGLVTIDPQSVTIAPGATTGTFAVTGVAEGSATISAASAGYNGASANILVAQLGAISLASNVTVAAGQSAPLGIALSSPAPSGGITITLTSADPSKVTVPATVFIPQNATAPATPLLVTGVALGSAVISASATGYTGDSQTVQVSALLTFAPTSLSVGVGGTQNFTLTLTGTAPASGLIVNLSSNNAAAASVPASVTITPPATSVTVPVTGNSTGSASITASTSTPNVTGASANVTVTVSGGINLPSNVSVGLGQTIPFPISLSAPAPTGGVTVTLTSSDPTKVSIAPATVEIAAGQTEPASQPQITGASPGSASITASGPGYGSTTQTVLTTASLSLSPQTLTISGTETKVLTVTLSGPAPAGGLTVNLASSVPGIVTIPATVQIAEHTTTANIQVIGIALGNTTITASSGSPQVSNGTGTITVQSAGAIILPSGISVGLGKTVPFQVTLPAPAPAGGVTVTLSSSDSQSLSISAATVTIAAGATQPATAPEITGNNLGTATISASAPTYGSTSQVVQVTATISFAPPSLTLNVNETQHLTLTLSGPAPVAGFTVSVTSSHTSAATVPSGSFTIPAGQTSVVIPVTGVALGSSVIHASAAGVAEATASISVQNLNASLTPANLTITSPGLQGVMTLTRFSDSSSTVNFTLTSSNPSVATVPTFVPLAAGNSVVSFQVTAVGSGTTVITAHAEGFGDVTANVTVEAPGTMTLSAISTPVQLGAPSPITITLSKAAPAGGVTVNLSSNNPKVVVSPTALFIAPGGTTGAAHFTGSNVGSATISASAQGFTLTSPIVVQIGATVQWVTTNVTLAPGQQGSLELRLFSQVPGGPDFNPNDGIAITLTSSNHNVATVPSLVFFFWDGSNVPAINIPVTAVGPGTTTITATGTNITPVTATVNVLGPISITTASLPDGVVGTPYVAALAANGGTAPLHWSATGLPGGLSINSATGQIGGTPTTAGTSNVNVTVTDSSSPVLSASANFALAITQGAPVPTSINVETGSGQSILVSTAFPVGLSAVVRDAANAPMGGVIVTFTAPGSGASGTFSNGTSVISAITNTAGIANAGVFTANNLIGSYAVTATTGSLSTSFSLTNQPGAGGGGTIIVSNLTIGQNLQAPLLITLDPPAPASGVALTVTSGNPSLALIGAAALPGAAFATANLTDGTGSVSTFVQALAGSGSTTVTVSAPGYVTATSTITLAPAGFVIAGPNGVGAAFTTFQSVPTNLTVIAGRLDGSSLFAEKQAVRGGFSITVPVNNSVSTVGTLSLPSVTLPGGGDSASVTFTGANTGGTDVSVITPAGFNTPATGTSLSITVQQSGILPFTGTVGQGLEKAVFVSLTAPAPSPVQLTIQSSDPTRMRLSTAPDGVGSNSIGVTIPAGQTFSPDFYVQSLASSGTVGYTITGTGLGSVSGNITLAPAGLLIQSPGGFGANFVAPRGIGSANITVITGRIENGSVAERQAVAGGLSVTATVVSDNTSVATISTSPVTIPGGSDSVTTQFQPQNAGQATVTATAAGFAPAQVTGVVVVSTLVIDSEIVVGRNLQQAANVILPQPAGAGGTQVTITANSSLIRISASPTGAGAASIVVTVPADQNTATFYVYGFAESGTSSFTATHASFNSATGSVILSRSGIALFPSVVSGTAGGSTVTGVFTGIVDSSGAFAGTQRVAGPSAVTVLLNSSDSSKASVPASVTIQPDTETSNVPITLKANGSTTITVQQPAGFTAPNTFDSTVVNVN